MLFNFSCSPFRRRDQRYRQPRILRLEAGFRDRYRRWVHCRLLAWYERMIVLKERELKKAGVVVPALETETSRRQLLPLDEDHVCLSRTVPHFARFAVFFAI
jgi:hypothetical protein